MKNYKLLMVFAAICFFVVSCGGGMNNSIRATREAVIEGNLVDYRITTSEGEFVLVAEDCRLVEAFGASFLVKCTKREVDESGSVWRVVVYEGIVTSYQIVE